MMGDFAVQLRVYDNRKLTWTVMFTVNRESTANQLYEITHSKIIIFGINSKFNLFYNNEMIIQCDTPLNEIFHGIEVDLLLISNDHDVPNDLLLFSNNEPNYLPCCLGSAGPSLITACAKCPHNTGDGSGQSQSCGPCNGLRDKSIIVEIVDKREDAWKVLCEVFNIAADVQDRIEANTEVSSLRCIDAMHHIYHSNTALTWDVVKDAMKIHDPHLAQVISECDFSHLN